MSQGFTVTQLEYFSLTQAAVVTHSQYQSLDATKQHVVHQKLAAIQYDLLNNPTEDGGSTGDASSADFPHSALLYVWLLFNRSIFLELGYSTLGRVPKGEALEESCNRSPSSYRPTNNINAPKENPIYCFVVLNFKC